MLSIYISTPVAIAVEPAAAEANVDAAAQAKQDVAASTGVIRESRR
jgi:hypothetical protein